MDRTRVMLLVIAAAVLGVGLGPAHINGQGAPVVNQTPEQAAATSLAAAVQVFGGTADPSCQPGEGTACIRPDSTPEQAARGIALFGVSGSGPEGEGAFMGILGRDPAGEWRFWFGTPNVTYQLLRLPGEMIVCADGSGVNVRTAPSADAEIAGTLSDLTPVTAEQFTLTEPGVMPTETTDQVVGTGWYRLSAPLEGWSSSLYLSDATIDATTNMPPCSIRNLFVGDE